MKLGRGRIKDCGVGVEDHQGQRQDIEDPSLDPVQLLEHPDILARAEGGGEPGALPASTERTLRQGWNFSHRGPESEKALPLPEPFRTRVERRHHTLDPVPDAHVLEGLFLASQVGEPRFGVDLGEQVEDHVGRDPGVGYPERGILERGNRPIDAPIGAGGNSTHREVGILVEEAALLGLCCQVDQGNFVGLSRQHHGAAGEGGEQPEGVELAVAEGGGRIVVTHRVALDRIPDPHVGEEQLAVGEGAGARIPHADFPAGQIPDTPDARPLAHHQAEPALRTGETSPVHVFVRTGVILQAAMAPQVDMPRVDHPELHPAPIDLAQVLQRPGRGLGLDGVVRGFLDRAQRSEWHWPRSGKYLPPDRPQTPCACRAGR